MMKKIEDCLHCGKCEAKCPYGLDTPRLLEENYQDYREILAGKMICSKLLKSAGLVPVLFYIVLSTEKAGSYSKDFLRKFKKVKGETQFMANTIR